MRRMFSALLMTATLAAPLSDGGAEGSPVAVASASTTPPTTPSVASAAPTVKPTTFSGGDWPGMFSPGG